MAERMVRISVRNFVEFMLRSGDIDNRKHVSSENAMVEGGRIHRMIQRRMGSEYEAEVFLNMKKKRRIINWLSMEEPMGLLPYIRMH